MKKNLKLSTNSFRYYTNTEREISGKLRNDVFGDKYPIS